MKKHNRPQLRMLSPAKLYMKMQCKQNATNLNITCYNCGKKGHYRNKCLNLKDKEKKETKDGEKATAASVGYIAWWLRGYSYTFTFIFRSLLCLRGYFRNYWPSNSCLRWSKVLLFFYIIFFYCYSTIYLLILYSLISTFITFCHGAQHYFNIQLLYHHYSPHLLWLQMIIESSTVKIKE